MKRYAKLSKVYAPTLKEDPADAELASHRLLLRAGFIRKSAAGLYTYLPLAWRSIHKIENIIREEMDAIDAQELQVPILTDAALWERSGRWSVYGDELMRLTDRHDRPFALGPTHEESFVDLVQGELRSYKQLPVTLYQIQDKFRDERRPRFGLMRGREFIMKDGYSFSASVESMQECYEQEKEAYARICERCGLYALPVVADSGQIGGDTSVEFMAIADAGEAELVYCESCGYAADTEAATPAPKDIAEYVADFEKISTPSVATIEDLAQFLHIDEAQCVKALALVNEDKEPCVVFIPGDHEMNDVKAEHVFGAYHLMTDEELTEFGLVKGYMGPVGLPENIKVYADEALANRKYWLVGANERDYHIKGAQIGTHFEAPSFVSVIHAKDGDLCPHCQHELKSARGIEVSQVFQLGTKYSEAMGATFMDEDGKEKPFLMGCYGIGVSRTLAAAVEQYHDDFGIKWPVSIAPYEVELIALDVNDDLVWPATEKLAEELVAMGLEVLVDDRKERPGFKFKDADLIGIPYQIVLGKKALANGQVEFKVRATGERQEISLSEVAALVRAEVEKKRACPIEK